MNIARKAYNIPNAVITNVNSLLCNVFGTTGQNFADPGGEAGDYPANYKFIQTEVTAKSSEETQMTFNLADININSLKFNISGSNFSLEFETNRKQKVVKIQENGVPEGFDDEIQISLVIDIAKAIDDFYEGVESLDIKLDGLDDQGNQIFIYL